MSIVGHCSFPDEALSSDDPDKGSVHAQVEAECFSSIFLFNFWVIQSIKAIPEQTRSLSLDAHDMMWLQTKFNKIRPILILQNVHILSNHSPQSAEKGLLTNVNPC